jgi:hypothetical protein
MVEAFKSVFLSLHLAGKFSAIGFNNKETTHLLHRAMLLVVYFISFSVRDRGCWNAIDFAGSTRYW